ncbi:MAG: hypothetical protein HYZ19_02435, partial [Rhodocyclales bacterium]|nr:hypothetical protein [Rhodocyclales bacterium]
MKHSAFFPPLDGAAPCGSGALAAKFGRVTKKLAPGADGAKRWTEHFGARLVCVRYREDAAGGKQYKTVELVVGERRLQTRRRDEAAIPVRV